MLILAGLLALACLPLTRITPNQLAWARDWWLRGVIVIALVFLVTVEPFLALVALPPLVKWQGPEQLPGVIVYGALIGQWLIIKALPMELLPYVPIILALGCVVHSTALVGRWLLRRAVNGMMGQRTHAAGALVLTMPFLPTVGLPVAIIPLLIAQSWLAWIAGGVAMTMMFPWAGYLCILAAFVLFWPIRKVAKIPITVHRKPEDNTWLDKVSKRGTSIDSLRTRMAVNRLLFWHLSWKGLGAGSVRQLVGRYTPIAGDAHCEPLQYLVEYGALGAVALLALVWRVGPLLRLHDPYSAAVVAGAILMLGTTPARIPQLGALWWAEVALLARV